MAYDPNSPKGHYNTSVKVPESVIEEIRQLGMEAALQKARSGEASPEFVEGVSRFYPNQWRDEDKDQYLTQGPILDQESPTGNNPVNSTPNGRSSGGSAGAEGPSPVDFASLSADAIQRGMASDGQGTKPPESNPIREAPSSGPLAGTGSPQAGPRTRGVVPGVGPEAGPKNDFLAGLFDGQGDRSNRGPLSGSRGSGSPASERPQQRGVIPGQGPVGSDGDSIVQAIAKLFQGNGKSKRYI